MKNLAPIFLIYLLCMKSIYFLSMPLPPYPSRCPPWYWHPVLGHHRPPTRGSNTPVLGRWCCPPFHMDPSRSHKSSDIQCPATVTTAPRRQCPHPSAPKPSARLLSGSDALPTPAMHTTGMSLLPYSGSDNHAGSMTQKNTLIVELRLWHTMLSRHGHHHATTWSLPCSTFTKSFGLGEGVLCF